MKSLTLVAAKDGGFLVMDDTRINQGYIREILFAGDLVVCLMFIQARMLEHEKNK